MSQKEIKKNRILPDNSSSCPVQSEGLDFSASKKTLMHMERDGNGIKIVEDGVIDVQAEIDSQACNAGLQNIIRLQSMRYGTIENAIARNKDKQTYCDVSHIPTSIAEQSEYIAGIQADVEKLSAKLGISKEELLKANQEFLAQRLAALNSTNNGASAGATAAEGGNE